MRSKAAKKYIFLCLVVLAISGFFIRSGLGLGVLALLFAWLARENALRTRFKFFRAAAGRERSFDLAAAPAQMEISSGGKTAVFVTLDQAMSLWTQAALSWRRPLEPKTLALLPLDDGACYYAVDDSLVLVDDQGRTTARLAFEAPQHRQSYHLLLSADKTTLCLHTPWFLQFAKADLSALKGRVSCEETGHYMKYAALAPDASRVYFAGAKLLEEAEATQARWGCWSQDAGAWVPAWSQAEEAYGNSHVRGLSLSQDASTLVVELHREGYEFRVLDKDGKLVWKRAGGENPCLGVDGGLLCWENPFEGLTLTELSSQKKLWARPSSEKIRCKAMLQDGSVLALEGRRLVKIDLKGEIVWDDWLETDPTRLSLSISGSAMALLAPGKAALVGLLP
jgi:hypothetical protein